MSLACIQLGLELRNVIALALHRTFAELHELAFRAAVLLVVHEIAAHFLDFCSREQLLPSTQPHGRFRVRKALIVDFFLWWGTSYLAHTSYTQAFTRLCPTRVADCVR